MTVANALPLISCVMPTYGRPDYVCESVSFFLQQDYPSKELVILNDCPGQIFRADLPNVRVLNAPQRFQSLGEKRNACIEAAHGVWIAIWDDDDVYLPWRLSYSATHIDPQFGLYRSAEFWAYWGRSELERNQSLIEWVSHTTVMYEKKLWAQVGGYPALNSREDTLFFEAIQKHRNQGFVTYPINERDRFMVLRGKSKYQHTCMKGGENPLDLTPGEYEIVPRPIADGVLRKTVNRLITLRAASWEAEQRFTSRSVTPPFPKIVCSVSDQHIDLARGVLERFGRHWPYHPQIDLLGDGTASNLANDNSSHAVNHVLTKTQTTTAALRQYIGPLDDPFILLWRHDHALCGTPDFDLLALAWAIIRHTPDVASFHLSATDGNTEPYACSSDLVTLPLGEGIPVYGSIWKRESLLRRLNSAGDSENEDVISASPAFSADHQEQHLGFSSRTMTPSTGSDGQNTNHAALPYRTLTPDG